MAAVVRVLSPAKINLHLEVYPRREDGFHDLLSVFQSISLVDEVEARSLKSKDVCSIEGDFDFPPERNIMHRAWELFRRETGFAGGVAFSVKKRVPEGAGLGGGSSNAAAALRALNRLSGLELPPEDLARIGAMAGSDVPFFCLESAALVSGRGDRVSGLPPRTDYAVLLVVPRIHISTRSAYEWLDAAGSLSRPETDRESALRRSFLRDSPSDWRFFNSFYPVLSERAPVFAEIRKELVGLGAAYAGLSGSGSGMFGVFPDRRDAERAGKVMEEGRAVKIAFPLEGMPEAIVQ